MHSLQLCREFFFFFWGGGGTRAPRPSPPPALQGLQGQLLLHWAYKLNNDRLQTKNIHNGHFAELSNYLISLHLT